jgi:hypothetical protein
MSVHQFFNEQGQIDEQSLLREAMLYAEERNRPNWPEGYVCTY